MALHRKIVALVLASLLGGASSAKVAPLGTIIHAERGHIGEAEVSAGCTIFEGDQLSTDAGGVVRITIPALTLQLGGQSSLTLTHGPGPEGNIFAEVAYGSLVFSAAPTGKVVVAADEALVRPAASAATVAHLRVVNRKELRIYAQRGALEFSYHGERETIPEGSAYRVFLDPSEMQAASLGPGPTTGADPTAKPPSKHHPAFILVAIAIAVGVGIAIPLMTGSSESPDRPGLSPPKKP